MTLTLDLGNTTLHGAISEDDKILFDFRKLTSNISSDEFGLFLTSILRENGVLAKDVDKVAISSVVPSINHSLGSSIIKYFKQVAMFLNIDLKTDINLGVENKNEVGADLIASCMGANEVYGMKNFLIVSMGTATTFTLLSSSAELLGVSIVPGIQILQDSLSARASQIPKLDIIRAKSIMGKDTKTAVHGGMYYSHLGAIKEIISLFRKESSLNFKVIGTGGFCSLFADELIFDEVSLNLVHIGLLKLIRLNSTFFKK